jgi:hypothetical protein
LIRGVVVVEDGDASQTYTKAINVKQCRYRGINIVATAGGTAAQVEALVSSGQADTDPLIRRKVLDVPANSSAELDELLEFDTGIASGDGMYIKVITDANVVTDSLSCIAYFSQEYG